MKRKPIKSLFKVSLAAVVLATACFMTGNVSAAVLAGWEVTGLTGGGPSPFNPTTNAANLVIGGLTKGSGVGAVTTGNVWGGNAWNVADEASAIAGNKFGTFTIQAASGYTVSVTNISRFHYSHSNTGPGSGELQYSTDGSTFIDGAALTYATSGDLNIDLSGVSALQDVSSGATLTFRIVNWGASGSGGTWYIANTSGNDFEVSGTVALAATGLPPSITGISPASITTNAGSTVAFTVTATGDPASYFWYKVTDSTTNLISDDTTPTLTLSNVLAADAASYFVILTNNYGADTSSIVSLTVMDPFIITDLPPTQTSFANTALHLSVGAAGTSLAYQWYQGTPDAPSPLSNAGRISGTDTGSLTISNLNDGDTGSYFVVVTNVYGALTSSVTAFTVIDTGVLGKWDFNGTFNLSAPVPSVGSGVASLLNGATGSSAGGSASDLLNSSHEGLANNGWNTGGYPASGSNKTAGVQFNVSTLGLRNVKIAYDTRASGTASKYMRLQYTTNGTDFVDYPASMSFQDPTYYESETFDLTGLPDVANNASFGFRIVSEFESTASYGATNDNIYVGASSGYSSSGLVRFDVVTINADSITGSGTPPTISSFNNITNTDESSAANINFTVNDAQTAASDLTVTAVSANQAALPSESLFVSNTGGGGRTLTVTPSLGHTGIAPVLVTVTDGDGDSTTTSFYVTVAPGNYPPVISAIVSTNILINSSLIINFTLTDDATLPANIALTASSGNQTLLPDANLVLSGSGTNRMLTITPTINSVGVVPITIIATDDDAILQKSSTVTFTLEVLPSHVVLLNDFFDYADGSLITNSGGFWQNHSGTPGQMQVTSGQVFIDPNKSEDVNAMLVGQPYTTNSPVVLYSSFTVNFSALPSEAGTYFAHFKDTNSGAATGYGARVWASTLNAAPGSFRLGIANGAAGTNTSGQFPVDLVLNSNYSVITSFSPSNGVSTIWINPTNELDASVTATDVTNKPPNTINVVAYALRENLEEGTLTIDNLQVGLSFISVDTNAVSFPPQANPDSYTVAKNSADNLLSPLGNDVLNTPGGSLSLVSVSATNGTATISGTNVLFTPTPGFAGTATIGYTITDGFGGLSSSLITVAVSDATPTSEPITYQNAAGQLVMSWTQSSFSLTSSTNVAGPYVRIPGATSPYTNSTSSGTMFFQLVYP